MKKTALTDAHKKLGAKMGPFAGYEMPLYYDGGVIAEHEWVRAHAGLFDVSHMGQVMVTGAGNIDFWQKVTPSAFGAVKDGGAKYTVLTNEEGGILDDLIVTRLAEDRFFAVINAGRKYHDVEWLQQHLPENLEFAFFDDKALVALQGPSVETVMRDVFGCDLSALGYMKVRSADLSGVECLISRLGYTGEDGFEISIPPDQAPLLWDELLTHSEVKPIGLAARDSLRLEMGYPLYGHDIDEGTSPVEAGLRWVIGKNNESFIGASRVRSELENGVLRTRVGVKLLEKGIAREGAELRDSGDIKIGVLTSGGFSPSLKESIGMGYVDADQAVEGARVYVHVRGRNIAAQISPMPFVPARTKAAQKKAA